MANLWCLAQCISLHMGMASLQAEPKMLANISGQTQSYGWKRHLFGGILPVFRPVFPFLTTICIWKQHKKSEYNPQKLPFNTRKEWDGVWHYPQFPHLFLHFSTRRRCTSPPPLLHPPCVSWLLNTGHHSQLFLDRFPAWVVSRFSLKSLPFYYFFKWKPWQPKPTPALYFRSFSCSHRVFFQNNLGDLEKGPTSFLCTFPLISLSKSLQKHEFGQFTEFQTVSWKLQLTSGLLAVPNLCKLTSPALP